MAKQVRQIIKIDEEKCNGCGVCVPACVEGAMQVIDGKARLVSETYCDGLGACLGECPQDAISFESKEADDFDEAAAMEHAAKSGKPIHSHSHDHAAHSHGHGGFACPSAKTIDRMQDSASSRPTVTGEVASELRQWPVKLYLVNPSASYFANADLLISADCVPFAYGGLHPDFLRGKVLAARSSTTSSSTSIS
jgi:Pyruvate/2-oxoacid:ferredoxin oxidoreductase delta subunit